MTRVLSAIAKLAVPLLFAGITMLPSQAAAWPPGPSHRSSHVPNVGDLAENTPNNGTSNHNEQPLGDMWTFYCPPGGHVVASVDTKDDTDLGTASLDPILELLDGNGVELASGDDENPCTYQPICGYGCPQITHACGDTCDLHSLIVRDYGDSTATGIYCNGGGGYELTVDVYDEWGNQLTPEEVQLGGGASRGVPGWAVEEGKAPSAPALDDENVPLRSPAANKGIVPPVHPPVIPPLPKLP
jgi:hypothetical protein